MNKPRLISAISILLILVYERKKSYEKKKKIYIFYKDETAVKSLFISFIFIWCKFLIFFTDFLSDFP